jgi:hypothetical protein
MAADKFRNDPAADGGPEPVKMPGALLQVGPDVTATDELRDVFRSWILISLFRDSVEVVSRFLEDVRELCAIHALLGPATITGEEWNEKVVIPAAAFHRLGLPDKITRLKSEYGVSVADNFTSEVLSVNQARNCLVHRQGVVSSRDTNAGDTLAMSWRCFEIRARNASGERVVTPDNMFFAKGTEVGLAVAVREKVFAIGERISFSPQEVNEICTSLNLFTREYVLVLTEWTAARRNEAKRPSI